jgi:hypothetical protein
LHELREKLAAQAEKLSAGNIHIEAIVLDISLPIVSTA